MTICDNLYLNDTYDPYLEQTQKNTSKWTFYSNLCFNIPALYAVALYGSWSDRFSRKTPLLFAPIGSIVNITCCILSAVYIDSNVNYLLIGQFVDGLSAGFAGFLMAAFSYTSHVTPGRQRTWRLALVYASQTLAFAVSSFASGVLLEATSYVVVYGISLMIVGVMLLYIIIAVPDVAVWTKNDDDRGEEEGYERMDADATDDKLATMSCRRRLVTLFGIGHMKDAFAVTFRRREGRRYVIMLVISALLLMSAQS